MTAENVFLITLFACSAIAGLFSRWAPLSGWAALAFALALPAAGLSLTAAFC